MRVVLASSSPRRRVLLALLVQDFDVQPAHVDETLDGGPPAAAIAAVAARKATVVARQQSQAIVLGADTGVVHDGEVLGKASDEAAARAMLQRLAGDSHEVTTAVALARGETLLGTRTVTTRVRVDPLPARRLDAYLACGAWRGKAGAYGVQDSDAAGFLHVPDEGWSNVVGLPLAATQDLLGRHGVPCAKAPEEAWLRRHNPF